MAIDRALTCEVMATPSATAPSGIAPPPGRLLDGPGPAVAAYRVAGGYERWAAIAAEGEAGAAALRSEVDRAGLRGRGVAGEDSAASAFLSGGVAQPRSKPPYPAAGGVHDRPTVVGNVETMAHVALIARDGAVRSGLSGPGTAPARCS